LRFRHFLEEWVLAKIILAEVNTTLQSISLSLKISIAADATLISALSWSKSEDDSRDPEMRQTTKGNQ